jgi:hypothetical protein
MTNSDYPVWAIVPQSEKRLILDARGSATGRCGVGWRGYVGEAAAAVRSSRASLTGPYVTIMRRVHSNPTHLD